MGNKQPDLSQPEIEAPHEKLLRPPTFEEKYSWVNKILLLVLVVMIINLGVYFIMQWSTSSTAKDPLTVPSATTVPPTTTPILTPTITQKTQLSPSPFGEQTACSLDAMQCPDGSWVGRTGPNCEFVCPK